MWGFEIQLANGNKAFAVKFADQQIYMHEPTCDTYATIEDLIADNPGCFVQPLGPVVATDIAEKMILEDYGRAYNQLHNALDMLEDNLKENLTAVRGLAAEAA